MPSETYSQTYGQQKSPQSIWDRDDDDDDSLLSPKVVLLSFIGRNKICFCRGRVIMRNWSIGRRQSHKMSRPSSSAQVSSMHASLKASLGGPFLCSTTSSAVPQWLSLGIIIAFIVVQWVFLLGQACQATRDEKDLPIEVALICHPIPCMNVVMGLGLCHIERAVNTDWPDQATGSTREDTWMNPGGQGPRRPKSGIVGLDWIGEGPHDLRLGEFDIY